MKHKFAGECVARVELSTLDIVLAAFDGELGRHRPVGFVKLDIEGFELPALRGAKGLLASDRAPCSLVVEVNPDVFTRTLHPWTSQELCTYMASLGYTVYTLDGDPYPNNTLDFNKQGGEYVDVLFRLTGRKLPHCAKLQASLKSSKAR